MARGHDKAFDRLLRQLAETPPVPHGRPQVRPGQRLAGRFRIEEPLGGGTTSQVFAAVDTERGARVAVKVIGNLSPESISQIKSEFRAASEIVHPNLVRLHELHQYEEVLFFTMDLVVGDSLPALLRKHPRGRRDGNLLAAIFRELALGLTALHAARMLHRDLKPSNFVIAEPDRRVVLLDFGLARPPGAGRSHDLAGTPGYMAPEQVRGEVLTEAADWYAFGVVLHEALTGRLPHGQPSPTLEESLPELAQLCRALLQLRPDDRPMGKEVLRRLGVPSSLRPAAGLPESQSLVGRQAELATLDAALERARAGQPAMVLVEGPSGIGKSVLVEQFSRAASARGALVLTGRCRERESMGYKAVDGLIDSVVAFLDRLPEHEAAALLPPEIADLVVLFPSLRAAATTAGRPRSRSDVPDRAVARQRAIAAFHAMIAQFRRRAPVLIWIDDLQWSDEESALLLGPLLGGTAPVPMLFIGSTRGGSGGGCPLLDALAADRTLQLPPLDRLPLASLSPAQSQRLALELLSRTIPDAEGVASRISSEAGGHPLFIAELAHGALLPSRASAGARHSTLLELVSERVAALPKAERDFLEVTAIAGAPLVRSVLRQAQSIEPTAARETIDALRANRLVRTEGLTDEDPVDVIHDRIREIVVQGVAPERRRQVHLQLARALEARAGTKPELVAIHYQAAGDLPSAGRHWIIAANQALAALAFAHAAELCENALAQAILSDHDARLLTIRRAEALAYAGLGAEAADVYLATADQCPPEQALELRRRAAEQLLLSGHLARGLAVIEEVLTAIELPPTRGGRRALMSLVAKRARLRMRGLRHRERSEAEIPRTELARLDASWTIASALGVVDFIRGAEFQARHVLLALRAGEPRRLLRALTLEAGYAAAPGSGSERRTAVLLAVADRLAQASQDDDASSLLCLIRGIAAYLQGRLCDAVKHCEEAIYILTRRSRGAMLETVTAQRFVIASLFFLGRLRRLAGYVPPLLAEAERNGNLYATMCFRSAYGTVSWLAVDAVSEARRQLDRARHEWRAEGFHLSHCNLLIGEAFLDFYAGDAERAHARFEEHWPLIVDSQLHRIGVLRVQLRHLRASSAVLAANLLEARGQHARARELRARARHAARRLRRDPVRRAAPLADLLESAVDRAEGESERARLALDRSIQAFDEQGMELFSAAARVRLSEMSVGERARLLAAGGRAELEHEGVANPERMIALLAPGFPDP